MASILFATIGSLGDLHPLMAIGRELQKLGHEVTIATSDQHGPRIIENGLNFVEIPPKFPDEQNYNRLMERWMDPKHGSDRVVREFVIPALPGTHEALQPLVAAADLVITHPFTVSAAYWAESMDKPWMAIPFAPLMFISEAEPPVVGNFLHPERLQWFGGPYPLRWLLRLAKWANGLGWKEFTKIRSKMGLPKLQGHPFLDYYMKNSSMVVAPFSRVLGQPQPDWPAQTCQTGFAFYDRNDTELHGDQPDHIEEFMAAGTPPIVFSLGSTGVYTAGDFYIQAWESAKRLGQRALLLVGPDKNVSIPQNAGPDCLIVPYAPHVRVFPKSSVVVHHGGVNTTGQAFRAGRPQLVVPLAHDQFDNAVRVERAGCGLSLPKSKFTAYRAVPLLNAVLSDASIQSKAKSAAETVASEPGAAGAAQAIDQFYRRYQDSEKSRTR